MIYLYGYICFLKTFNRTWELSLFSCYLSYVILSLFKNFKIYNLGQINKFILLFKNKYTLNMFCKTECALMMPFNNNY